MALLLPPRFYGSIFHIKVSKSEKKSSDPQEALLMTSKDFFFVLSRDWTQSVAQVSIKTVVSIDRQSDHILVTYKENNKVQYLCLESKKLDKLLLAISVENPDKPLAPPYNSLARIVPTYGPPTPSFIESYYSGLTQIQTKFFEPFNCVKVYGSHFCDLLASLIRLRFPAEAGQKIESYMDTVVNEINREWSIEWITALVTAAVFDPTQQNGYEYALRLVSSLAEDLHSNTQIIGADASDLFVAVTEMHERSDASKITPAAQVMLNTLNDATVKDFKDIPCDHHRHVLLILRIIILAFCGNMVQLLPLDIERITLKTIDFVVAIHTNVSVDDSFKALRKVVDSFSNEILRFMDARRYESSFRYVFVSHVVSQKICHMKL